MDTSPEAERLHLQLLRRATPAWRLGAACSLSRFVIELARRGMRRAHPDLSPRDLDLLFVALNYGEELARGLRRDMDRRGR